MMSFASTPDFPVTAPQAPGAWRGALVGLVPLALLAIIAALTVGLTVVARQLTSPNGFLAEQQAVVISAAGGLVVAAVVYTVACVRTLRRAAAWQRAGAAGAASGALWSLAVTGLIVLVPVLLAIFLPQHPAPIPR